MNADDSTHEPSCGPTQSSMVELWDGKSYSRQALDGAHEDLAQYATDHPVLEETMPDVSRRVAFGLAKVLVLATPLVWLPFVALLWALEPRAFEASLSVLAVLIVCSTAFFVCVAYLTTLARSRRVRPTTVAEAGQLTVTYGGDSVVARLSDCSWFTGRIGDMRLFFRDCHAGLPDPVLIIELPKMPRRPLRENVRKRVPVGFTPEMRAIWMAFLTLAEVPRGEDRTGSDFVSRFHGWFWRPARGSE
ncbi:MAG: hypothetical protein HQ582_04250 [Planctomycetes bacterium]|nr:hypothetical protein [Planctomycetota bacterium]